MTSSMVSYVISYYYLIFLKVEYDYSIRILLAASICSCVYDMLRLRFEKY